MVQRVIVYRINIFVAICLITNLYLHHLLKALLCDQGDMAIILVEQFFDFAYELGDEFTVMKRGAVSFNRRADGLDRQTLYDAVTV